MKRCGSNPPESNYICKVGDKVAALVKSSSNSKESNRSKNQMDITVTDADDDEEEENWILAEVVAYHSNTGKYDVNKHYLIFKIF